jgi:predicted NUDIX family NTP pyrophosphohydrolase
MVRKAAGTLVLTVMAACFALLAPAYWNNLWFNRDLAALAAEPGAAALPEAALVARVRQAAARRQIPLRSQDVRVERTPSGVKIATLYVVRADLFVSTVDLHFRPSAGR